MSPTLPPEILDLIVDHLQHEQAALKTCCVVSKSWISRVRAHLFAHIKFSPTTSPIESWTRVFPDPSNSPAHYARTLSITTSTDLLPTAGGTDARAWIRSFFLVTRLTVHINDDDCRIPLAQLHGFSPVLKSLFLVYFSPPPSEVFNLVCSFPSVADLSLVSLAEEETKGGWTIPSTSPNLTGKLLLRMYGRIRPDVRWLLGLPGGLHFSCISIGGPDSEAESTADLVLRCSDTMKSLHINYYSSGASSAPLPLDLSKATRLKDVELHLNTQTGVKWITKTLQTAKSEYLEQITIFVPSSATNPVQATVNSEWEDLDHLLVQLWTSRSVRPRLGYMKKLECDDMEAWVPILLPELTSRGIIEVVKR